MRRRALRGLVIVAIGGFGVLTLVTSGEAQTPGVTIPSFTVPGVPPLPTTTTPPPTMPPPTATTTTPPPTMPPPTTTPPPTMPPPTTPPTSVPGPTISDELAAIIREMIDELNDYGATFNEVIAELEEILAGD